MCPDINETEENGIDEKETRENGIKNIDKSETERNKTQEKKLIESTDIKNKDEANEIKEKIRQPISIKSEDETNETKSNNTCKSGETKSSDSEDELNQTKKKNIRESIYESISRRIKGSKTSETKSNDTWKSGETKYSDNEDEANETKKNNVGESIHGSINGFKTNETKSNNSWKSGETKCSDNKDELNKTKTTNIRDSKKPTGSRRSRTQTNRNKIEKTVTIENITKPFEIEDDIGKHETIESEIKRIGILKKLKVYEISSHIFPENVFLIIANEFCERFCFYGVRTVLVLYFKHQFGYDDNGATIRYHGFLALCYYTPFLGIIISEVSLGKFWTVALFSVIYTFGIIFLMTGSILTGSYAVIFSEISLALIAFGAGGIKPCVVALGEDQFECAEQDDKAHYFSLFYFTINLAGFMAMFISPFLRKEVFCFNRDSCYPLVFGLSSVMMFFALLSLFMGKGSFKVSYSQGSIILKTFRCIWHAIKRKYNNKNIRRRHWLYYSDDKYELRFIRDVKMVLNILLLLTTIPFFYALYDQTGSTWIIQASLMKGNLFRFWSIGPDQLQIFNPIFAVIFVPILEYCIYPICGTCNLLLRSLQRIMAGGIFIALSFLTAGFLQKSIERDLPDILPAGIGEIMLINNSPCGLEIAFMNEHVKKPNERSLKAFEKIYIKGESLNTKLEWTIKAKLCLGIQGNEKIEFTTELIYPVQTILLTTIDNELHVLFEDEFRKRKPDNMLSEITLFYSVSKKFTQNESFLFELDSVSNNYKFNVENRESFGIVNVIKEIPAENYDIFIHELSGNITKLNSIGIGEAGVYIIGIYEHPEENETIVTTFTVIKPNSIPIFYQIPQFVILTIGEIMLAVSGLEICYSQVPVAMKSITQIAWLLAIAFGNLFVVIIGSINAFNKLSDVFFLYSGLMLLNMIFFAIIMKCYKFKIVGIEMEENPVMQNQVVEEIEIALKRPSSVSIRRPSMASAGNFTDASSISEDIAITPTTINVRKPSSFVRRHSSSSIGKAENYCPRKQRRLSVD